MSNYLLPYTGEQVEDRLESPLPVALGGTGQTVTWENVTITADTTNTADFSANCRFSPYLRLVFLRGSFSTTGQLNSNTWLSVATIPNDYRPSTYNPVVTVDVPGGGTGLITRSNGIINIRTLTNRAAGTAVNFSAWWYL